MNKKTISKICFLIAVLSLIVGAAFHGDRLHPENVAKYQLGMTMGIVMVILFFVFLVAGIIFTILSKRDGKA